MGVVRVMEWTEYLDKRMVEFLERKCAWRKN